ncbi:glycosyltransferase [Sneathiella sp.]|uniref:glycosyltransferase n=1 Tax=Sneathiella sp. TaxID=1964365 RepID=UPI0035667BBD
MSNVHNMNLVAGQEVSTEQPFDGVICFGGVDWWYHNRGHYDLQMMREFSARVPVLYINSIGMRPPKMGEGAMFLKRVARKLKSLRQGLVRVRPNFAVYSPATLPGGGSGVLGSWIAKTALSIQIRIAARRCGIRNPLVWVACPPGATVLDQLNAARIIYQRTDRFEDFKGVDPEKIKSFDRILKQRSDIVLFCSRELYNAEKADNRQSLFVDHGVDFDVFERAGKDADDHGREPEDISKIGRPRVGFIGGIDIHTFDPDLFVKTARALPEVQFIMIGACSLKEGWCPLDNVHLLGQRLYEQIASYMAACDVLIMPWNQSDWIKACNPVKMKEYLAIGRPVVSTYFPEVDYFRDHISVATGAEEFTAAIRKSLANPANVQRQRERVRDHTWAAKADEVWNRLAATGELEISEENPQKLSAN